MIDVTVINMRIINLNDKVAELTDTLRVTKYMAETAISRLNKLDEENSVGDNYQNVIRANFTTYEDDIRFDDMVLSVVPSRNDIVRIHGKAYIVEAIEHALPSHRIIVYIKPLGE